MFVKYYYLVRHGETILNKEHKRQGEEGKLSDNGIQEVEDVAKRFLDIKINQMFVSPFERTRQTAEIINSYIKLKEDKIIITPLLAERRNPSIIVGKSYTDPVAKNFIDVMDKSIHDPNFRMYDEENFQDLKDRALEAQKYLIRNGKKRNLCVTHGIFLRMFLSTLLYGKSLTVKEYDEMTLYNPADNAAVTLVKYDYMKSITAPFKRFWDNILDDKVETYEDESKDKPILDKYSPWEILAYNDYTRDANVSRVRI